MESFVPCDQPTNILGDHPPLIPNPTEMSRVENVRQPPPKTQSDSSILFCVTLNEGTLLASQLTRAIFGAPVQ